MDKEKRKAELQDKMVNIAINHHVTSFEYLVAVATSIAESSPRIRQQEAYRGYIKRRVGAAKELEELRREIEELEKE